MGGWYDYATGIYYSDPESAVVYQSTVDGAQLGDTRHARRGRLSLTVAVTPAGDSRVTLKRTVRVVGRRPAPGSRGRRGGPAALVRRAGGA